MHIVICEIVEDLILINLTSPETPPALRLPGRFSHPCPASCDWRWACAYFAYAVVQDPQVALTLSFLLHTSCPWAVKKSPCLLSLCLKLVAPAVPTLDGTKVMQDDQVIVH